MASFSIPAGVSKTNATISTFRGVDLNNSPSNVDASRSPAAPNMIRDQVGRVRKRMGYTTVATAPDGDAINGVYWLGDVQLVHAGTKLYTREGETFTQIYNGMADVLSKGFVYDSKLYLLDGKAYLVYDGETVGKVNDNAYVPTIIISRDPDAVSGDGQGGTVYESLNLLGTKWKESFLGQASVKTYELTTEDLGDDAVSAEVLDEDGEWNTIEEGSGLSVNRTTGVVTFATAPGASPVTGMDNVIITVGKEREDYAEKINGCTVFCVYGVGGDTDRVFVSGNPEFPGLDWYSGFDDPTYFPDTGYSKVSSSGSNIVGYTVVSNTLVTFLDSGETGREVVVRQGSLDTSGEALFKVTNTLMGETAIAPHSITNLGKEPLFLTRAGVYAITSEELTGEKYAQERSYFIRNVLRDAVNVTTAYATVYNDFYVLSVDGDLYLLDGQQKTYEKNTPYSAYQYETYYWPSINARVLWMEGVALCFGRSDGAICQFGTNVDQQNNYNDDGAAIEAYWETGDFDGNVFFKSKTYTAIAVLLAAASLTGVKVFAQKRGIWSLVYDAKEKARYFDWEYIDFSKFVFSSDRTPHTLTSKVKIKKVDKVRFRLQNFENNEPFGLYSFGVEWKEPGRNYK